MIDLIITGNLGRDCSLKEIKDKDPFYTFNVAVSKGKGKDPQWVEVTLNKKYGDRISQYLIKGTKVLITGTPFVRAWNAKDTNAATASLCMFANVIEMVGGFDVKVENTISESKNTLESDDIPF